MTAETISNSDQPNDQFSLENGPLKHRLKIALVIRDLGNRSGGAERIYCELANLLVNEGHEICCLTYDNSDQTPFYPLDPRIMRFDLHQRKKLFRDRIFKFMSRVLPRGTWPGNYIRWKMRNSFFIEQLRTFIKGQKPDLMISFLPPANTPLLAAALKQNVKVIVTNHNVPTEDYENRKRWDSNPIDRKLRKSLLKRADAIHVLFPRFANWFPKSLQSKIYAIPNYASTDVTSAPAMPERENIIMAAGRLASVKNYRALIEAWKFLPQHHNDWQVHIFGIGPEERMLSDLIFQNKLESSIKLKGHTDQVGKEYRKAAIFCHPALFEGFGLVAAEALACETPVVAFRDIPGLSEFLIDGENSILAASGENSSANLAAALDTLISDPDYRNKLGKNGPASISEFSLSHYRSNWIRLIDKVMGISRNG